MTFLSLAHRLFIFLMLGLTLLAACDPSQTGVLRDPGGVKYDLTSNVRDNPHLLRGLAHEYYHRMQIVMRY
jgi:hypothetical protein